MKLKDLMARTHGLDIDMGEGDKVHIEYRTHFMTEAVAQRIEALSKEDEATQLRKGLSILVLLVAEWDLTDEKGRMFPLNVEKLACEGDMSVDVVNFILSAISADIEVPKAKSSS